LVTKVEPKLLKIPQSIADDDRSQEFDVLPLWSKRTLSIAVIAALLFLLEPRSIRGQEHGTGREVKTRVMPAYPTIARRMELSGKVRLEVTITADGHVKNVHPVGGHPVLVDAATNAIKGWRFAAASSETVETIEITFKDPKNN
jgi:TonB family protein